jgi:hypothetical protein
MPAIPADIDVFEIRKRQRYMRGCITSLVQSDLRRIGLLLMYNRYYLELNLTFIHSTIFFSTYEHSLIRYIKQTN